MSSLSSSSIEIQRQLEREASLIRVYEAELRSIRNHQQQAERRRQRNQARKKRKRPNVDSHEDNDLPELEDLFAQQEQVPSPAAAAAATTNNDDISITSSVKQECVELTQSIQGFVVSSCTVEPFRRRDNTNRAAESAAEYDCDKDQNQPLFRDKCQDEMQVEPDDDELERDYGDNIYKKYQYHLEGYFLAQPSVKASITMIAAIPRHDDDDDDDDARQTNSAPRKRRKCGSLHHSNSARTSRIIKLDCRLSSSENDENDNNDTTDDNNNNAGRILYPNRWYPIQQSAREESHPYSLPDWIQRMSRYLEFENQQTQCLQSWHEKYGCSWSRYGSTVQLDIPRTANDNHSQKNISKTNSNNTLELQWEWNWSQELDELRILTELTPKDERRGMTHQGLQDLVAHNSGSCQCAIAQVLEAIMT